MLYSLKVFNKDRWIRYLFLLGLVVQGIIWGYVIANVGYINKEVSFIAHTTIIAGANLSGSWWNIYCFSGAGVVVWVLNFFLAVWFFSKEVFLARILAAVTVVVEIVLLILIGTLIHLNT
jgi:hypothetical protein